MNDVKERMSDFQEKVAQAQAAFAESQDDLDRWVETTPEIIKLLRPRGLGKVHGADVEHFCYHGVIVCEHGKGEAIRTKMDEPMNNRLHGAQEAKVVSGR